MKTFRLKAHPSSEESVIVCGRGALGELKNDKKTFVFTDSNVKRIYGNLIAERFPDSPVFAMEAGEKHKTAETLFSLLSALTEAGTLRTDKLVCIGGGVVGDIGALAAALYMRGIACVQVPTTLLAQVDSSVGGKTAVDFHGVKNLVGVFRQPECVIADPLFLATLPEREISCGLGEMVKHAALDGALFDKLTENADRLTDVVYLSELIPDNIAIKADIVTKDPHETGLRKCLNLGHTTGHAFELSDGKLSHGEYVLVGLLFEAELAKRYAVCDGKYLSRLKELIKAALGKMPALPNAGKAAELALFDKKNTKGGTVTVTAPVAKGKYGLFEIPYKEYAEELDRLQEELC